MFILLRGSDILDRFNYNSDDIIKDLHLEDIYETVRIIDPIKKKIMNFGKDNYVEDISNCFAFWAKNEVCDNCSSTRAFMEDRVCTKLQKNLDITYLVISKPINVAGQRLVIEMLKDVSDVLLDYKINEEDYYKNTNDEVVRDSTTGAFNRRFLDERIQTDILNASNENSKLTILLANVNNLKNINKKYGHATGDAILAEIANEMKSLLENNTNWVARYGGDEFFVCLVGFGKNEAFEIAEKMRENIEKLNFSFNNENFSTSISFGIAEIGQDINSFEALMDLADRNLQMAKKIGKSSK